MTPNERKPIEKLLALTEARIALRADLHLHFTKTGDEQAAAEELYKLQCERDLRAALVAALVVSMREATRPAVAE